MDDVRPTDSQLIEQIKQGQEAALAELYERYSRLVYGMAYHITGSQAAAEEITLDVFNTLWHKIDLYDPEKSQLSTWLTRLARNRAIDRLRRENVRPEKYSIYWADLTTEPGDGEPHPESVVSLDEQRQRVRQALAELTPEQQEVLALAFFKGLSHSQIAAALGLPLGTVKGRIRAGMQRLRQLLQDEVPSNI